MAKRRKKKKEQEMKATIWVTVILCVFQINAGNLSIDGEFWDGVKNAYELGENNKGGGAVGAIVAIALVRLIGKIGTLILSAGVAILLLIFILEIDVNKWIADKFEEWRANKKDNKPESRKK